MKEARIYTNDFNKIIEATKKFVRVGNSNIHNYIRLEFNADTQIATAVSTDGCTLSVEHSVISNCEESFTAYIKPNVKLPKDVYAIIKVSEQETIIKCGEFSFGYEIPDGKFIEYEKAIPKTDVNFKIAFNGNLLISALQAAKASCGNSFRKPVVLEFRSPLDPVLLRTNDNDIKMVLPMRIRDKKRV